LGTKKMQGREMRGEERRRERRGEKDELVRYSL
jgi:hypothetical protein